MEGKHFSQKPPIRKEIQAAVTAVGLSGFLFGCSTRPLEIIASPTPIVRPAASPVSGEQQEERYDRRFNIAIQKAADLARRLPNEFGPVEQLLNRRRLNELATSGKLMVDSTLDPNIPATVRAQVSLTPDRKITAVTPTVKVHPRVFDFTPEEQVLVLGHELGHRRDQESLFQQFIGKEANDITNRAMNTALQEGAFDAESKELFLNLQQIDALKRLNPSFSTSSRKELAFEIRSPIFNNQSLYDIYKKVVSDPNPQRRNRQHPLWKEAVQKYTALSLATP